MAHRKTRKNPLTTAKDLGTFDIVDSEEEGYAHITLNGVRVSPDFEPSATTWGAVGGKPAVIAAGPDDAVARAAIGGTAVGSDVFTSVNTKAARTAIGGARVVTEFYDIQERQNAACDGVTDDTAAWAAAVAEVNAAPGGGNIWWRGISVVSQIALKSKVGIVGYDKGASRIHHKAGAAAGQHCIVLEDNVEYVTLRNFAILGRSENQTQAVNCIHFSNPSGTASSQKRHVIDNLMIHGAKGSGLYFGYGMRASSISNIVVHSCDVYGVHLASYSDNVMTNVDVGQSGSTGIFLHDCKNDRISNIKAWFSGRLVSGSPGIHVRAGNTTTLSNVTTQENSGSGLYVSHDAAFLTVNSLTSDSDNTSAGTSYHGLELSSCFDSRFNVAVASAAPSAAKPYSGVAVLGTSARNVVNAIIDPAAVTHIARSALWDSNTINLDRPVRFSSASATVGAAVLADREHRVTMTGNRTVAAPSHAAGFPPAGLRYRFVFIQDATGNRSITWNSAYKIPASVTFDKTANTRTIIEFECLAEGDWAMTDFITGIPA